MPGTTRPEAEPLSASLDGRGLRTSPGPGCGCVLGRGGRRSQGYSQTGGDLEVSAFSPSWLPVSGRGGAPLPFGVVPFLICGGPACTWRRGWGARCAWESAAASPSSLSCGCAGLSLERPSCCTPCAPQAVSPATICPNTSKTKLGMSLALGPQLWLLSCWWGSRQPGSCLLGRAALCAAYPGHSGSFRDAGQSALGRRG